MEKITIELELDPSIALLLGTFIHTTSQGKLDAYKMLTEEGEKQLMEIGQKIVDQVASKTKFPADISTNKQ